MGEFELYLAAARAFGVSSLTIGDIAVTLYPVIPGQSLYRRDGESKEDADARREKVLFRSAK